MAEKRYFSLRQGNKEVGVFTGSQPRQAALKAANRGYTDIKLRERGTKKIHIFKGSRKQVAAPENAPEWMGAKVWKPNVKKLGIDRLGKLK
ncbi:MAG: non-histone chromosomal MC1 family protein [Nanoarchaeota archaeon]|nr:non-histone chromosomal MC1 family protein [Nanoarchaeota archaeon]MBU4300274.1 non-histone chromosomal MC1 family protein [Nanoarchaeota archaeon]MBU4452513.1 non-histone chromosomal MC1 family protein [Nanoarchaeota archaeon]MCG2723217.1 non-histone chromosomal MC1 family protein [archaeon]